MGQTRGVEAGNEPPGNSELGRRVAELADLIVLDGGDSHRVAHYRRAATVIRRFHHSLAEIILSGTDLTRVPGIGKGLAGFLGELVRTGSARRLEDYRTRIPRGILDLMRVDGVGATRARTLRDAGVESVERLEAALDGRWIHGLDGFGPSVASHIRRSLEARRALRGKSLLSEADRAVARLTDVLRGNGVDFSIAGDIRRRVEIVATTDIVCAESSGALWDLACECPGARVDGNRGDNPVPVEVDDVPIRLVAVPRELMGPIAHHLTGPPAYLGALAARARSYRLEITPTGIVGAADTGGPGGTGGTATDTGPASGETAIYERLRLPWIPPELREDGTTIERAERGVPSLVTLDDIHGDLHLHTTWSDGAANLQTMVEAAAARGYSYIAVTDHSPSTGVVPGLDAAALRAQAAEIARVQRDFADIAILRGCEVDILPDGTLDLDDETLATLDIVLVSVHSAFAMSRSRMTDRIIRAMENPLVDVVCHLTGRKLGRRNPYPLDLTAVLEAARDLDVAVEVNGSPRRLDLNHCGLWLCRELGVRVVVNSDAHSVARLDNMRYGIDQARRGWLQAAEIANTRKLRAFRQWLGRRRD
ncbi:MAG: PHP domain-containing protein [Deltaproteobacteria bacterium]|nr:PHP domain-containing protein [Deltaproteobacteria bacterium]MDE0035909.1 PHP domain-containing protein [Deltaproteobacteria bacterium]